MFSGVRFFFLSFKRSISFSQYLFRWDFPGVIHIYLTSRTRNSFSIFCNPGKQFFISKNTLFIKTLMNNLCNFFPWEFICPNLLIPGTFNYFGDRDCNFDIGVSFFIDFFSFFNRSLMSEENRKTSNQNIFA